MILDLSSRILIGMVLCAISLGGNLGDVPVTFAEAVQLLNSTPDIRELRQSRIYRTAAMGAAAGDAFHNAACVFETTLAPLRLLDRLQEIEHLCGRVRTTHWGPRTLDLDLLLYEEQRIQCPPTASARTPRLTVPHPAMWYRRFVLDPLMELISDVVHPVFQQTVNELRRRLLVRPLPVCLAALLMDSIDWVETVMIAEDRPHSIFSNPDIEWLVDAGNTSVRAAILFAGSGFAEMTPHRISLPDCTEDAVQLITDVLTAALDEPAPILTRHNRPLRKMP